MTMLDAAPVDALERVPVTAAQQSLWFSRSSGDDRPHLAAVLDLEGVLNPGALAVAVADLVDRHEALRTSFEDDDGECVGVIHQDSTSVARRVFTVAAVEDDDDLVQRVVERTVATPFRWSEPGMLRVQLLRRARDRWCMVVVVHHAVADGASLRVMLRDLSLLYSRRAGHEATDLPPLPLQWADVSVWMRECQDADVAHDRIGYWRTSLHGAPQLLDLPTRARSTKSAASGPVPRTAGHRNVEVDPETMAAVRGTAARLGCTPYTVLATTFGLLLGRWSRQRDVLFGTPVSGRRHPDLAGVVGLLVSTVPVRVHWNAATTGADLLRGLTASLPDAWENADVGLERIVQEVVHERDPDRAPLVQTLFTWQEDPVGHARLPGVSSHLRTVPAPTATAELSLALTACENGSARGILEVQRERFASDMPERMARHFVELLRALCAAPDRPVDALVSHDAAEQARWAGWGTGLRPAAWRGGTLAMIDRRCAEEPDRGAVFCNGSTWTARQLTEESNRYAAHLAAAGVQPGDRVGVCLERDARCLALLLGVWRCGAAYVPLDPAFPKARLEVMVADSGCSVVVSDPAHRHVLPGGTYRLLDADECDARTGAAIPATASREPLQEPERRALPAPSDTAYVLFTSGSTGRPKGVTVSHRALASFVVSMCEAPGLTAADVLVSVTTLSFDIAALELFCPLVVGAGLVLATRDEATDPSRLAALVRASAATVMQATPATWRMLLDDGWSRGAGLRALCGGEALPPDLARRLLDTGARLWNLYGPTETTVWSTVQEVTDPDDLHLGSAIRGTTVHVLDDSLHPVPPGVLGELCIGGVGVADGYWSRPGTTAERFVADPGGGGGRLYRTGDLAYWDEDGRLHFAGRCDRQVKIRGHRVEPAETELALRSLAGVDEAVVVPRPGQDGQLVLCAYVQRAPRETACDTAGTTDEQAVVQWQQALTDLVPASHRPAVVTVVPSIPLTPNGKLDRAALPAPEWGRDVPAADPPRGPAEVAVADVVADVLGIDPGSLGRDDDFFALGGHSLAALRVVSRLAAVTGTRPPVRQVFEHPSVAALAATLGGLTGDRTEAGPSGFAAEDLVPLSPLQRRMWAWRELENAATQHVSAVFELDGPLDTSALALALDRLAERHDALRWFLRDGADEPGDGDDAMGAFASTAHIPLTVEQVDASGASERVARHVREPFDWSSAPLVRALLLDHGGERRTLALTAHHVVVDGRGAEVLASDLSAIYRGLVVAGPPTGELPPVTTSFGSALAWQAARAVDVETERAFWSALVAGYPQLLALPGTVSGRKLERGETHRVPVHLDRALAQDILALAARTRTTDYTVLATAVGAVLGLWCGAERLLLGVPVSGRDHRDLDDVVGAFVNTVVLPVDVAGDLTVDEAVRRTGQTALTVWDHSSTPFQDVVDAVTVDRAGGRAPLVQAVVGWQHHTGTQEALDLPGVQCQRSPVPPTGSVVDLTLSLATRPDGQVEGWLEYRTSALPDALADLLVDDLMAALREMVARPDAPLARLAGHHAAPHVEPTCSERTRLAVGVPPVPTAIAGSCGTHAARTALSTPDLTMTYGELAVQADAWAGALRDAGVGPGSLVAVNCSRSPGVVAVMLGTWWAGGAFVPVDPTYPPDRTAWTVTDAAPAVIVTDTPPSTNTSHHGTVVIGLRSDGMPSTAAGPQHAPLRPADRYQPDPDELAYVLYTSGSTGRPKGVAVRHGGLARFVDEMAAGPGPRRDDVVLAVTTLSFDIAQLEVFGPLVCGAEIVLADDEDARDPERLAKLLDGRVTLAQATPSTWQLLVDTGWVPRPGLRVMCGGEALSPSLARALLAAAELWNVYGPTETTVWSTALRVTTATDVSLGRPLAGTGISVRDRWMRPTPTAVPGELMISGAGLAQGYWGRPDLTADRFVPDPDGFGGRMYRTGDLAVVDLEGRLHYRGRMDQQVKVRGHRLELSEVEDVLRRVQGVRAAAVRGAQGQSGTRVDGYVVLAPGCSVADVRRSVRDLAPDWMVPATLTVLDALPCTPNGKTDRAALPSPDLAARPTDAEGHWDEPDEDLAQVLAQWAHVLGPAATDLRSDSDFFAVGGDSILAARLLTLLRRSGARDLALADLVNDPTPAGMLAAIRACEQPTGGAIDDIELARADAMLPWPDASGSADSSSPPGGSAFEPTTGRPRAALVTGATGFLGARLVRELLESRDVHVLCPVRATDAEHAQDRLRNALQRAGTAPSDMERAHATPLDLAGLAEDPDALARACSAWSVAVVFHAAAEVDFVRGYRSLRAVNVLPLPALVRLCLRQAAPLHYVSTLDEHGVRTVRAGQSPAPLDEGTTHGYVLTKKVGEHLVERARAEGADVVVHRPGLIGPDQHGGHANPTDLLAHLARACVELTGVPDLPEHELEMLPVDVVARAVVAAWPARGDAVPERVYRNLRHRHPVTLAALAGALRNLGHPVRLVEAARWFELAASSSPLLGALVSAPAPASSAVHGDGDGDDFGGDHGEDDLDPDTGTGYLAAWLADLQRQGLVPPPPSTLPHPNETRTH